MDNPLIRKLKVIDGFTEEDAAALMGACSRPERLEARRDIIHMGDPPYDVHVVLDGFAYRYKLMPNGRRQIVAVMLPGDFCDLHVAILGEMDHSIATLTDCTIVKISGPAVRDLTEHHPRITRALWWCTLVDEATLREWLANNGQRDAFRRMAHLFCEMRLRLEAVGLADAGDYALPLTQEHIADILGLTSVHVNRTLQELRAKTLVTMQRKRVTLHDVGQLEALCGFDPTYLHRSPRCHNAL